jgi:hypothetical protein
MPPKKSKITRRPRKKPKKKVKKPKVKTVTKVVYKNVGTRETLPVTTTQTSQGLPPPISYSQALQRSYDTLRNPSLQYPVVPQAPQQSNSFDKYMELITTQKLEQFDREKLEREKQKHEQLRIEQAPPDIPEPAGKKPTGLKALQMNELMSNPAVLQDNNIDPRNNLELIKFSNKLNNMGQKKFQETVKKYDVDVHPVMLQKPGVTIEEVEEEKPKSFIASAMSFMTPAKKSKVKPSDLSDSQYSELAKKAKNKKDGASGGGYDENDPHFDMKKKLDEMYNADIVPKESKQAEDKEGEIKKDDEPELSVAERKKLIDDIFKHAEMFEDKDKNGKTIEKRGVKFKKEYLLKKDLDDYSDTSLRTIQKRVQK